MVDHGGSDADRTSPVAQLNWSEDNREWHTDRSVLEGCFAWCEVPRGVEPLRIHSIFLLFLQGLVLGAPGPHFAAPKANFNLIVRTFPELFFSRLLCLLFSRLDVIIKEKGGRRHVASA